VRRPQYAGAELTVVDGHKAFSMRIKSDVAGWGEEADINILDVELENRLGMVSTKGGSGSKLTSSRSG
jgi:hypothetical protein